MPAGPGALAGAVVEVQPWFDLLSRRGAKQRFVAI
jgi:hypothetical protein